jgi:hypothetical protein
MDRDNARRRHVWVDVSGGYRRPGLVIAWRRRNESWEGYVAVVREGSVPVTWSRRRAFIPCGMTVGGGPR